MKARQAVTEPVAKLLSCTVANVPHGSRGPSLRAVGTGGLRDERISSPALTALTVLIPNVYECITRLTVKLVGVS